MLTTVDGVEVVLNDPDRPPTLKPFVVQRYRHPESDKDPPVVGDALAAACDKVALAVAPDEVRH